MPPLLGAVQSGNVLPRDCGGAVLAGVRMAFGPLFGEWLMIFFSDGSYGKSGLLLTRSYV